MSKHFYSQSQDSFILNCNGKFGKQKVQEFNRLFDLSLTRSHLVNRYKTLTGANIKSDRYRSPSEKKWFEDNYHLYMGVEFDWPSFTRDFNKRFDKNVSIKRMKAYLYNSNLSVGRTTKQPPNKLKIGDETCFNDRWFVKVKNEPYDPSNPKKNFQPKSRYMYERYYNVILKDDEYVIQLDGDKENFEKDNLLLVDKKYISYMNNEWWLTCDVNLKKIMYLYANLKSQIDKFKGEQQNENK